MKCLKEKKKQNLPTIIWICVREDSQLNKRQSTLASHESQMFKGKRIPPQKDQGRY